MSETQTITLTDFLQARLAEDEAAARGAKWRADGYSVYSYLRPEDGAHISRHEPDRVLARCEAMRAIMRLHSEYRTPYDAANGLSGACSQESSPEFFIDGRGRSTRYPCSTVRALAAVYADHPDYREEWRP